MQDCLNVKVLENDDQAAKVFLQILSGDSSNRCKIESVGRTCILRGKVSYSGLKSISEDYEVSLDSAQTISISYDESSVKIPIDLKPEKIITITASRFGRTIPLDSIILRVVLGHYLLSKRESRSLALIQAKLNFKDVDSTRFKSKLGENIVTEMSIWKLTIVCCKVQLPRGNNLKIEVNTDTPTHSQKQFRPNPRHWWSKLTNFCGRRSFTIEIFLSFLAVLVWLIVRSKYDNDRIVEMKWWLVLAAAFLVIFSFRSVISRIVNKYCLKPESNGKSFFVNGWNAWSYCGAVRQGSKVPIFSLPSMLARAFHDGGCGSSLSINMGNGTAPHKLKSDNYHNAFAADHIASDMFTALADIKSRCGVVIGFLSQKEQFGCIAANRTYDRISAHCSFDGMLVSPGSTVDTDWLLVYTISDLIHPFRLYMEITRKLHQLEARPPPSMQRVPVGWSSVNSVLVSEKALHSSLLTMSGLVEEEELGHAKQLFELFHAEEGYARRWGDWMLPRTDRFPNPLSALVQSVHNRSLRAGLWLAPFACDKDSETANQHPDWLLRDGSMASKAAPSNSGYAGKFFYGLDATNPGVQQHLTELFTAVCQSWKLDYVKLDFLYASVLAGSEQSRFDRFKSPAQVLQQGMTLINDILRPHKVYVMGSGAPLGAMIGQVHGNRVCADCGSQWRPEFSLAHQDQWHLPCARNMIRSSLNRLFMHNYWWSNDTDCLRLSDKLSFTLSEVRGMATVKAFSGGSVIVADDLSLLSSARQRILLQLLPPVRDAAIAIDLLQCDMPELLRLSFNSTFAEQQDSMYGGSGGIQGASPITTFESMHPPNSISNDSSQLLSPRSKLRHRDDISRWFQHYRKKSQLLTIESDLPTMRKEKNRMVRLLQEDMDRVTEDAHSQWITLAVCNWSASKPKTHYISLREIFGERYLQDLLNRSSMFSTLSKVKQVIEKLSDQQLHFRSNDGTPRGGADSPSIFSPTEVEHRRMGFTTPVLAPINTSLGSLGSMSSGGGMGASSAYSIKYERMQTRFLLHVYDFWEETYSDRVVSLEGNHEDLEVAFEEILVHSAKIFHVGFYTDPLFPKYLGSNLHFSCGKELQHCYLSNIPMMARENLYQYFNSHLLANYKRRLIRQLKNSPVKGRGGSGIEMTQANAASLRHKMQYIEHHRYIPVIKSFYLELEEHALRAASWQGFVMVFLPINPFNPGLQRDCLEFIDIQGAIWNNHLQHHRADAGITVEGKGSNDDLDDSLATALDGSLEMSSSFMDHSHQLFRSNSLGAAGDFHRPVPIHTCIDEPECKVKGAVFKIPVCRVEGALKKTTNTAKKMEATSSSSGKLSLDIDSLEPEPSKCQLIVSWIMDIKEDAGSASLLR